MKKIRQVLGLECHGDSLLTGQVTAAMNIAVVTWAILFVIETLAWGAALSLAYNVVLAALLAWLMPAIIVAFDITVYTSDLSRTNLWLSIMPRLVVIAVINFVTATPMVMSLFDTEIRGQLVEDARERAVVLINEDYDRKIKAQEELIAQGVTQEQQIRDDAKVEIGDLSRRISTFEQEAREEARREGRAGVGEITQYYSETRDDLENRRRQLRQKLEADLKVVKLDERRSGLIKVKSEQAEALARVPSMQMEELKAYGAVATGVLARLTALDTLEEKNETVANTSLVLHLGVLVFGLLAFSIKFLQHSATDKYYTERYRIEKEHRPQLAAYERAKRALIDAIGAWRRALTEEIAKDIYQPHVSITTTGGRLWADLVASHIGKLEEAEEPLRSAGLPIVWDSSEATDPRLESEPWRLSDTELRNKYSWGGPDAKPIDRTPKPDLLGQLQTQMKEGQDKVAAFDDMVRSVLGEPEIVGSSQVASKRLREMRRSFNGYFKTQMQPHLARIHELVVLIRDQGNPGQLDTLATLERMPPRHGFQPLDSTMHNADKLFARLEAVVEFAQRWQIRIPTAQDSEN